MRINIHYLDRVKLRSHDKYDQIKTMNRFGDIQTCKDLLRDGYYMPAEPFIFEKAKSALQACKSAYEYSNVMSSPLRPLSAGDVIKICKSNELIRVSHSGFVRVKDGSELSIERVKDRGFDRD